MKAVVDTNLLVSAAMSISGPPSQVIDLWSVGRFELVTSPALLDELSNVLSRPRIRRFTDRAPRSVNLFDAIRTVATIVEPTIVLDVVRDLDDNRVLEAAVTGRVDAVVSGDRDLLELGEYEGIAILTAVQFLGMLAELEGLE